MALFKLTCFGNGFLGTMNDQSLAMKLSGILPKIYPILRLNYSGTCLEEVHPREITVCTGAVPHNCCYDCARRWVGDKIDEGKYIPIYGDRLTLERQ
jgi:hypothetical protein